MFSPYTRDIHVINKLFHINLSSILVTPPWSPLDYWAPAPWSRSPSQQTRHCSPGQRGDITHHRHHRQPPPASAAHPTYDVSSLKRIQIQILWRWSFSFVRHTKYIPPDDRNKILTGQGGRGGWWNARWAGSGQPMLPVPCSLPMLGETLHSSGQARAGLTLWFMIHNCYKLETNTNIL